MANATSRRVANNAPTDQLISFLAVPASEMDTTATAMICLNLWWTEMDIGLNALARAATCVTTSQSVMHGRGTLKVVAG